MKGKMKYQAESSFIRERITSQTFIHAPAFFSFMKLVFVTNPGFSMPKKPGFITEKPDFVMEKPRFMTKKPGFIAEKPGFVVKKPDFVTERPGIGTKTGKQPLTHNH